MKIIRNISILLLLFVVGSSFSAPKEKKSNTVYIMGTSLCFGDSILYFTDIQTIDSVKLTKKEHFLPDREGYSDQLRNYLENKDGNMNHTCITYFSEKKAALQKIRQKLLKRYQAQKESQIKYISTEDFKYVKPITE